VTGTQGCEQLASEYVALRHRKSNPRPLIVSPRSRVPLPVRHGYVSPTPSPLRHHATQPILTDINKFYTVLTPWE